MKKILGLVLTLFISSFIYAAPADPMHKQQDQLKQDFDKISKELNITDDQKQKINELMQADITKKRELRQQIKQKSNAIDEELMKEKFDIHTVNQLTEDIEKLSAEISKINIESKLNVRSILTYEQYSRMELARRQLMEQFKQEREKKQMKVPQKNKK